MKVGFLVNPIAGMGGAVGLKGTDGKEILKKALSLGAEPVAPKRAQESLSNLSIDISFLTCSGRMGEESLRDAGIEDFQVVYEAASETSAEDTRKASSVFLERRVDLVLFCGGDGTAKDVFDVIGDEIPMLGIPAGVKMHSAVFAVSPSKVQSILDRFSRSEISTREAEVMDVDEEKLRVGTWDVKLYGYAKTPYERRLVQTRKFLYLGEEESESKKAIAKYVAELLKPDVVYFLGPGTTTKAVADELGLPKTLLGIDALLNGEVIGQDLNEKGIMDILTSHPKGGIIISPIGAQGFVFGRGNQPFSPSVIRKVGPEKVMILATPYKLGETEFLRVDTGDPELDKEFTGYKRIISGYHSFTVKKVEA